MKGTFLSQDSTFFSKLSIMKLNQLNIPQSKIKDLQIRIDQQHWRMEQKYPKKITLGENFIFISSKLLKTNSKKVESYSTPQVYSPGKVLCTLKESIPLSL